MTRTPRAGDVLIRPFGDAGYVLVDGATHEQIAVAPDLQMALKIASERDGAVWRENVDNRGRPLGNPVLLLPRASVPRPDR